MNLKKSFMLLSLIALSLQGAEHNLKDAVLACVSRLDVQKELSRKVAKRNYVNFLECFNNDPQAFTRERCRYVEEYFPAFQYVRNILETHVTWAFVDVCGLKQDKLALARDPGAISADQWDVREREYMRAFKERCGALSPAERRRIRWIAVQEASCEILRCVKAAEFISVGPGKALMVVRPQEQPGS